MDPPRDRDRARRLAPFVAAWWPAIVWAGVIYGLSSIPGSQLPSVSLPSFDKAAHAAVYMVLGALCLRGVRRTSRLTGARAVLVATCLTALYGVGDEFHQHFTPKRTPDWHDAAADAAGGLAGALALVLLRDARDARARHRRG